MDGVRDPPNNDGFRVCIMSSMLFLSNEIESHQEKRKISPTGMSHEQY